MNLPIIKQSLIILLSFFGSFSCFAQTPVRDTSYIYRVPQQLNDGIVVGGLKDAEIHSIKIIKLTKLISADTDIE